MKRWRLYRIQDDESPAFVVALDLLDAVRRWRLMVNDGLDEDERLAEGDFPTGVEFLDTDYIPLILPDRSELP